VDLAYLYLQDPGVLTWSIGGALQILGQPD